MPRRYRASLVAALSLAIAPVVHAAQDVLPNHITTGSLSVTFKTIATGLSSPVYLSGVPDSTGRLFVVDQTGQIQIIQNGVVLPTPFLDVSSRLVGLTPSYDERGLLGLAFDPNYASNGKFYTYESEPVNGTGDFTLPGGVTPSYQNVLATWQVSGNPNVANAGSFASLMKIDKVQGNHNGGTIAFGPDGKLYMGLGDGGAANDSGAGHVAATGNGQDLTTPLGKMLRLDVSVTPGLGERRQSSIQHSGQQSLRGHRRGGQGNLRLRPSQSVPLEFR